MLVGRGLATAALLVLIALTCIAVAKRLEGERRMLRKLRELRAMESPRPIPLDGLSAVERDTLDRLQRAGVLKMDRTRGFVDPAALRAFRAKRIRFALSGALLALIVAMGVAVLILR